MAVVIVAAEEYHVTKVISKLNANRKTGRYCDLILNVENEQFPCHRCVLAATIPYFERMFNGNFIECRSKEVKLDDDVNADSLEKILNYAYTGVLEFDDNNNSRMIVDVINAIELTDYFELVRLNRECLSLFEKYVNVDNVFEDTRF